MKASKLLATVTSLIMTSQAFAFSVLVNCKTSPGFPEIEYHVYSLDSRIIAKTEVQVSNTCMGGGCGGSREVTYEGKKGNLILAQTSDPRTTIKFSKLPKSGEKVKITKSTKGDNRFGESDKLSTLNCTVH